MRTALLTLTLLALSAPAAFAQKAPPREPHPLAPSLPLLTDKEQAAIEGVIERFIEYDTGKLKGTAGAKALADFNALGREAIPALLDGLNRAANMEDSCPAVLIAKKLARFLTSTDDMQLLDFARETIGAGVTARRHTVVLKDLKVMCQLRKAALQRRELALKGSGTGGQKPPVGDALFRQLARESAAVIKSKLTDERAEVRLAAVRAAAARGLRCGSELIDLLTDDAAEVRQAARRALLQLSRGQDFGPRAGASETENSAAVREWRAWWGKQGGK